MFSPLWSVYHPNVSSRRHMRHFWSLFHQFLGLSEHIFTQTNVREDCDGDCQKARTRTPDTSLSILFSHQDINTEKQGLYLSWRVGTTDPNGVTMPQKFHGQDRRAMWGSLWFVSLTNLRTCWLSQIVCFRYYPFGLIRKDRFLMDRSVY